MSIGGPTNFLNRLNYELKDYNLPQHIIINPHPNQWNKLNSDCLKVGRLDGAYYYKSTGLNMYNLVLQRRNLKFPWLRYIPDNALKYLTRPLNMYLNRGNKTIIKHCDCLVFQSKISEAMHKMFVTTTDKKKVQLS
tara:strand:- start:71 stop:478 length:408 start_codon:yes stop_codon:yes gene_type:complete